MTQATRALAVRGDDANVALGREMDKRMAVMDTSLAAGIDPQRLKNVALATFTKRPELWDCDPVSIARAIVECGQAGLEPTGLLGGAYLVPFFNSKTGKQEAQLIIGYRGLAMLAMRSGLLRRIEARVVHAKDEFAYQFGIDPILSHRPLLAEDTGNVVYAYAVAFYRDGDPQFDVMSLAEIEVIHRRSKSPDKGPWITDFEEMCKKTVLRRLSKLLPLTVEVARVLDEIDPEVDHHATVAAAGRRVDRMSELRRTAQKQLGRVEATEGTAIAAESVEVPRDPETMTVEEASELAEVLNADAIEGEVTEAPTDEPPEITAEELDSLAGIMGPPPQQVAAAPTGTPQCPVHKWDMRPDKRASHAGEYGCSGKMPDGSWCSERWPR